MRVTTLKPFKGKRRAIQMGKEKTVEETFCVTLFEDGIVEISSLGHLQTIDIASLLYITQEYQKYYNGR